MDFSSIINAIIALVLFVVFAIVYFIILLFVIDLCAGFVFTDLELVGSTPVMILAASVLAGATIVGSGRMCND